VRAGLVAVLAATAVALAACGSSSSPSFPAGTPPWIRQQAMRLARGLGDDHPTAVRVRRGPYVAIAVTGHFTCTSCSVPPGGKPPTGTLAVIKVDPQTRRGDTFALCRARTGFCGVCDHGECGIARYALDVALDALGRQTKARGEVDFSRYVGFYRKCGVKDPAAEYGVISGNCRVAERIAPQRILVTFAETWHGLDRTGRRTLDGPLRRHAWRITLSRDGRLRGVSSTGFPPPQFDTHLR